MYTLRSVARRSLAFGASAALVAATVLPSAAVFAQNALNPLTERSLLLTSSAPGYMDTDGSGNSENNTNAGGTHFAPPGSGPNGKKTGQTFTFRVSTNSATSGVPIRAFTLQYCTAAAGNCQAPGNNDGDARTNDREDNDTAHAKSTPTSDLDVVTSETTPWAETANTEDVVPGSYQVLVNGTPSPDWVMTTKNVEDDAHTGSLTGKNNFIVLTNTEAGALPAANDKITIKFTPDKDNYITNPGDREFFVKINTYSVATEGDLLPASSANIIDGGVTVANVMTESIHITTKVLETMSFSVGTRNKDTQTVQHGSCDPIEVVNNNRLNLGDENAEYSLRTDTAFDVYSYWRLSSNSSGGATVYYSGDTLQNTVGDSIRSMETKAHSQPGTEQFGLALIDAGQDTFQDPSEYPENHPINMVDPEDLDGRNSWIYPLGIEADYADGGYVYNNETEAWELLPISEEDSDDNAQFKFNASSQTIPEVIAQNSDQVISCATSKVRYVANIAADTPAGVYTTKINFLAAPQY